MKGEEFIPLGIYCGLTALNMFYSSVLLVYLSLAIPIGLMVMKVKKDKDMKYWLIFGTIVGILYPIGEYFSAPPGWGGYSINDIFILNTPVHMSLVLVFAVSFMGYISKKMKLWQSAALACALTFIIENFNVQAGFWYFTSSLVLWHIPLYVLISNTISLSLLRYFKFKIGPIIFAGFSGIMWVFTHALLP